MKPLKSTGCDSNALTSPENAQGSGKCFFLLSASTLEGRCGVGFAIELVCLWIDLFLFVLVCRVGGLGKWRRPGVRKKRLRAVDSDGYQPPSACVCVCVCVCVFCYCKGSDLQVAMTIASIWGLVTITHVMFQLFAA